MNCLIVDDESNARDNLEMLVNKYCNKARVVAKAGSIDEAVKLINAKKPDLVFMDIRMGKGTGFDILNKFPMPLPFKLIFVTAYDEYALKAFKYSAMDYLLKPVEVDDLVKAVEEAGHVRPTEETARLKTLIEKMTKDGMHFNKIALPTVEGLTMIRINNIIRCESSDNYTSFYMADNTRILVSKTIKYYEELLQYRGFFRVHQSHLINLNHIERYVKGDGGYAVMSDGSSVIVSRRRKDAFLKVLHNKG